MILPATALLFLFFSCATLNSYTFLDDHISKNDYSGAVESLKSNSKRLYSSTTDGVLKNLDQGMLEHYAGRYNESNQTLTAAEVEMEKLYGISISETMGSYILNDYVKKYEGDDYEDLYINLFKALNYIELQDEDSAFVEIRRMDNKTKMLATKYGERIEAVNEQNRFSGVVLDKSERGSSQFRSFP